MFCLGMRLLFKIRGAPDRKSVYSISVECTSSWSSSGVTSESESSQLLVTAASSTHWLYTYKHPVRLERECVNCFVPQPQTRGVCGQKPFKPSLPTLHARLPSTQCQPMPTKDNRQPQVPSVWGEADPLAYVFNNCSVIRDLRHYNHCRDVLQEIANFVEPQIPSTSNLSTDICEYAFPTHIVSTDLHPDIVW